MKTAILKISGILAFALLLAPSAIAVKVGDAAPDFTAKDVDGKSVSLSDHKGKYVVLEWHNQGCPYVVKHYSKGNMQSLQSAWTKKGVVWLSIISSAPGKQGHVTPSEEKKYLKEQKATPTSVVFDSDGAVGRLYGAKTTPHMFIVSPDGKLIYQGAIDDKKSTDSADIPGSNNYVSAALESAMLGKPIKDSSTPPYGCSVKY